MTAGFSVYSASGALRLNSDDLSFRLFYYDIIQPGTSTRVVPGYDPATCKVVCATFGGQRALPHTVTVSGTTFTFVNSTTQPEQSMFMVLRHD